MINLCKFLLGIVLLSSLIGGSTAAAQLADKKVLTLTAAKKIATAAEAEAAKNRQ